MSYRPNLDSLSTMGIREWAGRQESKKPEGGHLPAFSYLEQITFYSNAFHIHPLLHLPPLPLLVVWRFQPVTFCQLQFE